MKNSTIAFVAVLAILGLLTACNTTKAKRRHIQLPPVPSKLVVQKTMSPKVAAQQIKYGAPPPLDIPPPPGSNHWITLSFSTNGPGIVYNVYMRPQLDPGTGWTHLISASASNASIQLPFDAGSPPMFFTATATQFVKNITLAWDASPSSGIAGYRLYYGPSSRGYTNVIAVSATSCTVSNVKEASTYYFAATAYDTNGIESDYSTETNFFVPRHGSPPVRTAITLGPGRPAVLTSSASSPFPTNGTMFGRVMNTGGDAPITMFFYGTKNAAFKTNAWEGIVVTGVADGTTNLIQGVMNTLSPGTTYYCAFAARNAAGTAQGNILSFTTPVLPPKAKIKKIKEEPVFSPLPEPGTPAPPARIFIDPS